MSSKHYKFPNKLKSRAFDEPVMAIDWMPTFAKLTKSKLKSQNKIDGKNIWPLLTGESKSKHLTKNYTSITELMNYTQLKNEGMENTVYKDIQIT